MTASIITPTLDAAGWIEDCIRNVAEQGSSVAEHVIVDGGSRDGTIEKIESLARRVRNLILIVEPDCNQSAALNRGTAASSADIVGILNVDDFYETEAVSRAVAFLKTAARPAFVAGDCRVFNADRRFVWNRPDDLRLESLLLGWNVSQFPCNPSAYFYHREVHDIVGGYDVDDDYSMDVDFIFKCAAKVGMHYVPEHWGNFRWGPGGKTFEDRSGPLRRSAMIDRHLARLGPDRKAAMDKIRIEKARDRAARFEPFRYTVPLAEITRGERGSTLARRDEQFRFSWQVNQLVPARPGSR